MPLCRLLYLSSAVNELQLERTCYVCLRFTNVAQLTGGVRCFLPSCQICSSWQLLLACCIAFRAKLYTGSGIIVRVFDQVMMFAFLTDSTTVLLSIPWHTREKNMFSDDLFCFFFKFFTAWFRFELTIKSSSLGMFFAEVSDQS